MISFPRTILVTRLRPIADKIMEVTARFSEACSASSSDNAMVNMSSSSQALAFFPGAFSYLPGDTSSAFCNLLMGANEVAPVIAIISSSVQKPRTTGWAKSVETIDMEFL